LLWAAASHPAIRADRQLIEAMLQRTLTRHGNGSQPISSAYLPELLRQARQALPLLVRGPEHAPLDPGVAVTAELVNHRVRLHPGEERFPLRLPAAFGRRAAAFDEFVLALLGFSLTDMGLIAVALCNQWAPIFDRYTPTPLADTSEPSQLFDAGDLESVAAYLNSFTVESVIGHATRSAGHADSAEHRLRLAAAFATSIPTWPDGDTEQPTGLDGLLFRTAIGQLPAPPPFLFANLVACADRAISTSFARRLDAGGNPVLPSRRRALRRGSAFLHRRQSMRLLHKHRVNVLGPVVVGQRPSVFLAATGSRHLLIVDPVSAPTAARLASRTAAAAGVNIGPGSLVRPWSQDDPDGLNDVPLHLFGLVPNDTGHGYRVRDDVVVTRLILLDGPGAQALTGCGHGVVVASIEDLEDLLTDAQSTYDSPIEAWEYLDELARVGSDTGQVAALTQESLLDCWAMWKQRGCVISAPVPPSVQMELTAADRTHAWQAAADREPLKDLLDELGLPAVEHWDAAYRETSPRGRPSAEFVLSARWPELTVCWADPESRIAVLAQVPDNSVQHGPLSLISLAEDLTNTLLAILTTDDEAAALWRACFARSALIVITTEAERHYLRVNFGESSATLTFGLNAADLPAAEVRTMLGQALGDILCRLLSDPNRAHDDLEEHEHMCVADPFLHAFAHTPGRLIDAHLSVGTTVQYANPAEVTQAAFGRADRAIARRLLDILPPGTYPAAAASDTVLAQARAHLRDCCAGFNRLDLLTAVATELEHILSVRFDTRARRQSATAAFGRRVLAETFDDEAPRATMTAELLTEFALAHADTEAGSPPDRRDMPTSSLPRIGFSAGACRLPRQTPGSPQPPSQYRNQEVPPSSGPKNLRSMPQAEWPYSARPRCGMG
jgi:hypothetical protein